MRPGSRSQKLGLSAAPQEFGGAERVGRPLLFRSPPPHRGFPALVTFSIWPDISHERMEGGCNEDLCVFRARLVSQRRETRSLLPISIFHSRFGERSRARGARGG